MGNLYLARSGKTIRLVGPEGTYSYYHPDILFTGLGWDAQTASTLLLRRPPRNILILGLGGATVARQCRVLYPHAEIVGVEINGDVIKLAYEHFNLDSINVFVIGKAGQDYLKRTRRRFDAIIDDMWWPELHSVKPLYVEPKWAELVRSRLNPEGLYAVNLYSRAPDSAEVRTAIKLLKPYFQELREVLPGPPGETATIVGGFNLCSPREARAKLRLLPAPVAEGLQHVRFLTIKLNERRFRDV
jgi:spermidine synthase